MQGYFVITKDSEDDESSNLKKLLNASKLVNLQCTRTFNRVTGGIYKKSAASAVTHLRNEKEELRAKRKAYHEKPEVKERIREYNQRPEVKERKRLERLRRKKLLSLVPKEILEKVYKDDTVSSE